MLQGDVAFAKLEKLSNESEYWLYRSMLIRAACVGLENNPRAMVTIIKATNLLTCFTNINTPYVVYP
jgi:hypothetical protein